MKNERDGGEFRFDPPIDFNPSPAERLRRRKVYRRILGIQRRLKGSFPKDSSVNLIREDRGRI